MARVCKYMSPDTDQLSIHREIVDANSGFPVRGLPIVVTDVPTKWTPRGVGRVTSTRADDTPVNNNRVGGNNRHIEVTTRQRGAI